MKKIFEAVKCIIYVCIYLVYYTYIHTFNVRFHFSITSIVLAFKHLKIKFKIYVLKIILKILNNLCIK